MWPLLLLPTPALAATGAEPSDAMFGVVMGAVGVVLLGAAAMRMVREQRTPAGIQPGSWVLVLMGTLLSVAGLLTAMGIVVPEPVR